MRIDLHTHSRASDGTQSPAELVRAAAAAGLDVLGLTDHDTAEGWPEAERAARETGVVLVRGMEISTRHRGSGVHLLAYLPDPDHPPLVDHLRRILDGRTGRVPTVLARLREQGVEITADDVRAVSGDTVATGRPHVADALVRLGVVADRDEAFATYLGPGRPAYVDRHAPEVTEMIRVVSDAGGVSVVAHPWGRMGERPDEATIADLRDAGLAGLEVDHQDHDTEDRERLRGIARDLDLVVTGSSDHHGLGKVGHELGVNTTAAEEYERLVARAAEAAARSGRDAPEVVAP
ncbi:PHP domain-containing protein [Nocardioides sp. SYSU D00038]|uniref:PHP domain-containing protein n=1 Tax=Nocardioides sp. SYSU D00038 TaxID=2812554 RepID=UPI001966D446|nr:PHP domain-containing protein [Nocardioides sp. SYSU D00038]